MNCETYPETCGYEFLIQDWHVNARGGELYFASSFNYAELVTGFGLPPSYNFTACELGVKVKLVIEDREAIPVYEDDGSSFDFANTDTVKDLEAAIGHLGRILILAQFSIEQRVRSEGICCCYVSLFL